MKDKLNNYYSKERKYNKIPSVSRNKGGQANRGTSIFSEEYQNMTWQSRAKKSALKASDNGRCWWIFEYLIGDSRARTKDAHADYRGNPKDLHPTWSK